MVWANDWRRTRKLLWWCCCLCPFWWIAIETAWLDWSWWFWIWIETIAYCHCWWYCSVCLPSPGPVLPLLLYYLSSWLSFGLFLQWPVVRTSHQNRHRRTRHCSDTRPTLDHHHHHHHWLPLAVRWLSFCSKMMIPGVASHKRGGWNSKVNPSEKQKEDTQRDSNCQQPMMTQTNSNYTKRERWCITGSRTTPQRDSLVLLNLSWGK